jgi:RNA polymerase sigma-70 factor (ECF subfamily)
VVTDEQLAEAARRGSSGAFDELVGRYQGRLLRFLVGRCNSRADAEDAIQDTFVNAYRYLHSYNPRWRFSTWLYRIALRNASRLRNPGQDQGVESIDPVDPLAACIEQSERQNLWLLAKAQLSKDAYSALWLRYVEELPLADVATAMERSIAWTKVSLMRSRKRLAIALREEAASADGRESYGQA